jgi:hypothetical protein
MGILRCKNTETARNSLASCAQFPGIHVALTNGHDRHTPYKHERKKLTKLPNLIAAQITTWLTSESLVAQSCSAFSAMARLSSVTTSDNTRSFPNL